VYSEGFDCQRFLPPDDVSARLAEGAKVEFIPSELPTPQGTPKPCGYATEIPGAGPDGGTKYMNWQFTLDCRPAAEGEIDLLWKTKGAEPDTKPSDVGKKGIDHSRFQLVFFDEDSGCAVWLVGPDEGSRQGLGRLVAERLTRDNRPHDIRGVKVK
jgi:hypothetical protein